MVSGDNSARGLGCTVTYLRESLTKTLAAGVQRVVEWNVNNVCMSVCRAVWQQETFPILRNRDLLVNTTVHYIHTYIHGNREGDVISLHGGTLFLPPFPPSVANPLVGAPPPLSRALPCRQAA